MAVRRRFLLASVGTALLPASAGCLADREDSESTETGTPRSVDGTPGTSTSTTPSETQGATRYIRVSPVEDQDVVSNADPESKVHFEDLSPQKQQEFQEALDGQRVATTRWNTQPLYVKYEGSWYSVDIIIDQ